MDWKSVGSALAKIGLPLLGSVLPVPGGAALGVALASMLGTDPAKPEDVLATITGNAEAFAKAKQFELQHQEKMLELTISEEKDRYAAETAQIQAVNASIQADAHGDSWLQKNHHAVESLATVGAVILIYFFLPIMSIQVPQIPESAWLMLGSILGVTAWQRGAVSKQIAVNNGDSAK